MNEERVTVANAILALFEKREISNADGLIIAGIVMSTLINDAPIASRLELIAQCKTCLDRAANFALGAQERGH